MERLGLWSCLLAWLSARSAGGGMVLRLEDLDPDRCREEYCLQVMADLRWLGLDWDNEPVWQSRRTPAYKAAFEALADKAVELGAGYDNSTMFICHGDCIEDAQYLEQLAREKCGVKEAFIGNLGAVIGSHAGPGTLALFFMGNQR